MKTHSTIWGCVALASLSLVSLRAAPARAASLQKVEQGEWGVSGLPGYVNMYIYVPDKLAANPPIVVAPHHCQGTGPGTYGEMSSLVSIADDNGFVIIFPEATGENCWDAGSVRSLMHDGGGDTQAIVEMVRYTLTKYNGDATRVYAVGGSSGGIMTEALLGVYPDVFMAGVSLMGVPCGCWAEGYNDVTGTGNTAQWAGPCAGGNVSKTGQQWGDLVRSYFPGYTGHRPRLQHWHGTADTTLDYKNLAEDSKEWTNLLGLSESPMGNETPTSGITHQFWKNACGYTVYETFALADVGHAVPFDGEAVAAYFGLDNAGGQDPETIDCPDAVPGAAGTADAGDDVDANGSGGMSGTSGVDDMGSSGGAQAVGSGGAQAVGSDGAGGTFGSVGTGGVIAPSGTGGVIAAGGSGGVAAGTDAAAAMDGSMPKQPGASTGCRCDLVDRATGPRAEATAVFLAALGALLVRARRRERLRTRC